MKKKNSIWNKNVSIYSKLETIDRANYFIKFEKFIKKKKIDYIDANSQNKKDRLNKEISDVHQIIAENINFIMVIDKTINTINILSENIKDYS